jgi:hypothetical protein
MRRQRPAAHAAPDSARLAQRRVALLGLRLLLGNRLLEVLKTELQLLIGQTLGLAAELQALQLQQQMMQPLILRLQRIAVSASRSAIIASTNARSASASAGSSGASG